ncbi:MAG: hypothetical protein WCR91_03140 [Sphaerochaetaceae bacterium]
MRRLVWIMVFLIHLIILVFPLAADNRTLGLRTLAMGSAGVALTGTYGSLSINPASLLYQEETEFLITASAGDAIIPYDIQSGALLSGWQLPRNMIRALFNSKYAALSIELEYLLSERNVFADYVAFKANSRSRLQLNVAYGNENVAAGLFAIGGTTLERTVELTEGGAPFDYLQQTFFERYYPVAGSQFFSTGAGLLVSYQMISLGLATDSLFRMDYVSNELVLELGSLIDDLTVGLGFKTPVYDKENELNRIVFSAAVDISNIGSETERELRIGSELLIQLISDYGIAIRFGYREQKPKFSSLFSFSTLNGMGTFGLGAQLGSFELNALLEVPITVFDGKWLANEGLMYRVGLSFTP